MAIHKQSCRDSGHEDVPHTAAAQHERPVNEPPDAGLVNGLPDHRRSLCRCRGTLVLLAGFPGVGPAGTLDPRARHPRLTSSCRCRGIGRDSDTHVQPAPRNDMQRAKLQCALLAGWHGGILPPGHARLVGGDAAQGSREPGLEPFRGAHPLEPSLDEGAQAAMECGALLAVGAESQMLVKVVIATFAERSIEEKISNALHIVTEHSCFLPGCVSKRLAARPTGCHEVEFRSSQTAARKRKRAAPRRRPPGCSRCIEAGRLLDHYSTLPRPLLDLELLFFLVLDFELVRFLVLLFPP